MINMIIHSPLICWLSEGLPGCVWLLQINILFLSSVAITLQLITPQIILTKRKQTNKQERLIQFYTVISNIFLCCQFNKVNSYKVTYEIDNVRDCSFAQMLGWKVFLSAAVKPTKKKKKAKNKQNKTKPREPKLQ